MADNNIPLNAGDLEIIQQSIEEKNPAIFTNYYMARPQTGFTAFPGSYKHARYLDAWKAAGKPKEFASSSAGVMFQVRAETLHGRTVFVEDRGYIPLPWAIEMFNAPQKERYVIGVQGVGKAQPLYSRVLTPSGWTTMGDIQAGDFVVGRDGEPHRVAGVYPQGKRPIYEVKFTDGSTARADAEHIWLARIGSRPLKLRTTLDLAQHEQVYIPVMDPAVLPKQNLAVDPYLVGVLLGDGNLNENYIRLTSADQQIVDEVNHLLPDSVSLKKVPSSPYDYEITRDARSGSGRLNPFYTAMREVGVWDMDSHEKRIPPAYLWSSIEDRIALLQGLLDTDGCVHRGYGVEYATVSETMASQVKELVHSLGGLCTLTERMTSCNGKQFLSHRLYIRLPVSIKPFRLSRKLAAYTPRTKYAELSRRVKSVAFIGYEDAQCIMVDSAEHLYVTDDWIVTHNTMNVGALAMYMCATNPNFNFYNVAPTQYISKQMLNTLIDNLSDTLFLKKFIKWHGKKWFKEQPFITIDFLNGSRAEFLNVEKQAMNIQSTYGDWYHLDEGGQLNQLDETGAEVLTGIFTGIATRMRGTRPSGVPRLGWLSMTSAAYDCDAMWDRFDAAKKPNKFAWARLVLHNENPYLTEENLASFRRHAQQSGEEAQIMDGERPQPKGAELSGKIIETVFDKNLLDFAAAKVEAGEEGWKIEVGGAGVQLYEVPRQRDHIYMMTGDPGTGTAPDRNSPTAMVWDVTDFPEQPAVLSAFWWGDGGGRYTPFVSRFEEWAAKYRVDEQFRGYDSTSNQKAIAELSFEAGGLPVIPLGFEGVKKWQYLNALKLILGKGLMRSPEIHGLRQQLSRYRIPDAKIAQDLVSTISMGAFLLYPLYRMAYPDDVDERKKADFEPAQELGRSYRPVLSRNYRTKWQAIV